MDYIYGGLFFIMIVLLISVIFGGLGIILGKKVFKGREMLSSFECGFDPMESSRSSFSLRFFILAIVFMIFDVELVLLLPYILMLGAGVDLGFKIMMGIFVLILLSGVVHELNEGSLDWSS